MKYIMVNTDENTLHEFGQRLITPYPLFEVNPDIDLSNVTYDGEKLIIIDTVKQALDLKEEKSKARALIDQVAGQKRAALVSNGESIEMEYQLAEAEAKEWDAAGRPPGDVPASIQSWRDALQIEAEEGTQVTMDYAANSILAASTGFRGMLNAIRRLRLAGKSSVKVARTVEEVHQARDNSLASLKGLDI